MGTVYKGLYLPADGEGPSFDWAASVNANWTLLADAHFTAQSFFLPSTIGRDQAGSPATSIGIFPNRLEVFPLTNGITTGVNWTFQIPYNAVTGTFTVRPFWFPSSADAVAHSVQWQMDMKSIVGVDIGGAGVTIPWTGVPAARTTNISVLETGAASIGFSPAAGAVVRFTLSRLGGNVADTLLSDIQLMGVRIDYAAF